MASKLKYKWLNTASNSGLEDDGSGAIRLQTPADGGLILDSSGISSYWKLDSTNLYSSNSGNIGIGISSPDQKLHVWSGNAGAITASSDTQLVVESNSTAGINILAPDNMESLVYFGSPSGGVDAGGLKYDHNSDTLSLRTSGSDRVSLTTSSLTSTVEIQGPNGSAGTPAFGFSGDTNNGMYLAGSDNVGISAGGTGRLNISTSSITSTLPLYAPSGSQSNPSYTFEGDTDTGIYHPSSDAISVVSDASVFMTWGGGQVRSEVIHNTSVSGYDDVVIGNDSPYELGFVSSSIKYKGDVQPLTDYDETASKIFDLNLVSFKYRVKDHKGEPTEELEDERDWGVIAEEAQEVLPQLVRYHEDGSPRSFYYKGLIIPMLYELKKTKSELSEAKETIKNLRNALTALEKRVSALEI